MIKQFTSQLRSLLPLASLLLLATNAMADVKPASVFTSGAVLQHGMRLAVWGTAEEGEQVTVRLQSQKVTTTAKGGKWMLYLKPLKPGGPYTLYLEGKNTIELTNILVGDVYVCSGQSNMQWPMTATENAESNIAAAKDTMLRLFSVPRVFKEEPQTEVVGKWEETSPATVRDFSAVAYYFGKHLREARNIPIGLIHTSWGGTPAQAWTRHAILVEDPILKPIVDGFMRAKEAYPRAQAAFNEAQTKWKEAADNARAEGKPVPPQPRPPASPVNQNSPSVLYNAMIAPLIPYGIRGAIWYQGESNAGAAWQYQTLFPKMISNWRSDWGQGDFPFFFVQLASFMKKHTGPTNSAWAELREAQRLTTMKLPNAGMAVITDVGEEDDIHPRKKREVGDRLALLARTMIYKERITPYGPFYDSSEVVGNKIVVRFKHVGSGLEARDGELRDFTIAGEDGVFRPAQAMIQGKTVVVSSPEVPKPVAVRYGWANFPLGNLWNKDGIPATPFRTDNFPLTTQPK